VRLAHGNAVEGSMYLGCKSSARLTLPGDTAECTDPSSESCAPRRTRFLRMTVRKATASQRGTAALVCCRFEFLVAIQPEQEFWQPMWCCGARIRRQSNWQLDKLREDQDGSEKEYEVTAV
jgi:hypothetical protein